MNGNDSVDQQGLANFLAREFAAGGSPTPENGWDEFDANDVAGYVRGGLLPGRRAAFQRALLRHPELREAVQFEEAAVRRERKSNVLQRLAAVAIAAAVIAIMILPFTLNGTDGVARGRELLADGDTEAAVEVLEAAYRRRANPETAQLLALARCANGDTDPLDGLDLGRLGDWAPLGDDELIAPPETRGATDPAIGLNGSILDTRPTITVRRGTSDLTLVLYRRNGQVTLFRTTIPGGAAGEPVTVTLPESVADLDVGAGYGIELRYGAELMAHADFRVAGRNDAAACARLVELIDGAIASMSLKAELRGNLYLRRGFYREAIEAWSSIPDEARNATVARALELAERRLWNE